MKTIIASFIISFFLATGIYAGERLSLLITNINPARGKLYVAVYNSAENYMDPGSTISREIIPVTADTAFVVFDKKTGSLKNPLAFPMMPAANWVRQSSGMPASLFTKAGN